MSDQLGWLGLMQHYRLPTRLLDWTESPLTALYFAVSVTKHGASPGMLWRLAPHELNKVETGIDSVLGPSTKEATQVLQGALGKPELPKRRAVAILPFENDLRMLVQASMFTAHNEGTPLELRPELASALTGFRVAAHAKEELRRAVFMLGVRRSTLFPDLESLAKELRHLRLDSEESGPGSATM